MNPCDKHEAQDVRESGTGFHCKVCEIERLSAEVSDLEDCQAKQDATIDRLSDENGRLVAEGKLKDTVIREAREYMNRAGKPYETSARRILRKALADLDAVSGRRDLFIELKEGLEEIRDRDDSKRPTTNELPVSTNIGTSDDSRRDPTS